MLKWAEMVSKPKIQNPFVRGGPGTFVAGGLRDGPGHVSGPGHLSRGAPGQPPPVPMAQALGLSFSYAQGGLGTAIPYSSTDVVVI